jgi:Holliday junction DNA helicase RuvA
VISRVRGKLLSRRELGVEVATEGGVVYEVEVPLTVVARLPAVGEPVELRTVQIVREDSVALYGFLDADERRLFQALLGATGVGAKLALAMLSTYSAPRLVRALSERDLPALVQVPGVGKKTAERLVVELADRVEHLGIEQDTMRAGGVGAHEAARALVALGMSFQDAERAVQEALEDGKGLAPDELVRRALALPMKAARR